MQLENNIQQLQKDYLYRTRRVIAGRSGIFLHHNNKKYISFCSNNYLGLADHPKIIKAMQLASEEYGVGSSASALITGYFKIHQQFESEFAHFVKRDSALLMNNGYMANLGVVSTLASRKHHIFQDRYNHASLIDAGQLSNATTIRYHHNDMAHLQQCLERIESDKKLIITDGVFSTHGDLAKLPKIVHLAKKYRAKVIVDDAHGIGVLGNKGAGSCEFYQTSPAETPDLVIYPLGKAFGIHGAMVAGSSELIENLIQHGRSYIYTTALPPAIAAAGLASLHTMQQETWRLEKLNHLINYFNRAARTRQLNFIPSFSAIHSLPIATAKEALTIADHLLQHGFLCLPLRPPSTYSRQSLLRITLSSLHDEQHIDSLLDNLVEAS